MLEAFAIAASEGEINEEADHSDPGGMPCRMVFQIVPFILKCGGFINWCLKEWKVCPAI
jgi:hypothetical protein